MVVNGMTPDPAYIAYAVQRELRPLYFYLPLAVGSSIKLLHDSGPRFQWMQLRGDEQNASFDGFQITLVGMPMIVSTKALLRDRGEMLDRVRVMQWETPLGLYQVRFDWSAK